MRYIERLRKMSNCIWNYIYITKFAVTFRLAHFMGYSYMQCLLGLLAHYRERVQWYREVKEIKQKYSFIHIYSLASGNIGETISHFIMHVNMYNDNKGFKLLLSGKYATENKFLLKVIDRTIPCFREENFYRLLYICRKCHKMISTDSNRFNIQQSEGIVKDIPRGSSAHINFDLHKVTPLFAFTEEELSECERKTASFGLASPYVCIANRDSAYQKKCFNRINIYAKLVDSPISDFEMMASALEKEGILTVRMGRITEAKAEFSNCIDYANNLENDDMLDFYIFRGAKFAVTSLSGIYLIPLVQGVPIVTVNVGAGYVANGGGIPMGEETCLFIPKKLFKTDEERYLNLWETLLIDRTAGDSAAFYEERKIELINNTPQEICDVTLEMNARIDGTWQETEEDIELQKKYHAIIDKFCAYTGEVKSNNVKRRIGAKYLRENQYLLRDLSI